MRTHLHRETEVPSLGDLRPGSWTLRHHLCGKPVRQWNSGTRCGVVASHLVRAIANPTGALARHRSSGTAQVASDRAARRSGARGCEDRARRSLRPAHRDSDAGGGSRVVARKRPLVLRDVHHSRPIRSRPGTRPLRPGDPRDPRPRDHRARRSSRRRGTLAPLRTARRRPETHAAAKGFSSVQRPLRSGNDPRPVPFAPFHRSFRAGGARARDLLRGGRCSHLSLVRPGASGGLSLLRRRLRWNGCGRGRASRATDRRTPAAVRRTHPSDQERARLGVL